MLNLLPLRTSTFRLALIYLGLFLGSVLLVLGLIHWQGSGFLARQADQDIQTDMRRLLDRYQDAGLSGLVAALARPGLLVQANAVYLVTLPSGAPLVGNLSDWPDAVRQDGWTSFRLDQDGADVRALALTLPQGYRLLVGREVAAARQFQQRLDRVIGWAAVLTVLLGIAGGFAMSRSMLQRLDALNRTMAAIRYGALVSRVPTGRSGDEFDQLAANLNAMLDRIAALVAGMRHVSQGIAHDLRTPLTRLRARLELAALDNGMPPSARTALDGALAETDRLLETFRALLDIAEVEAGAAQADDQPVRLDDVARRVAELYEPVAESRAINLALDDLPPITVRGHEQLLSQALANLVDNALKYGPEGGRVVIGLQANDTEVSLSVADNGPGIPDAFHTTVRQRFGRLERDYAIAGSGLGLSLVEAVARRHCGRLVLADNQPGLRAVLQLPNNGNN